MRRTSLLMNKKICKRFRLNNLSSITKNEVDLLKPYIKSTISFNNVKKDIGYDKISSQLLKDLSKSTKISLSNGVNAIEIGNNGTILYNSYCDNAIFERSFYNDLLKRLREEKNNILIGNPGTSKSMFQYYYLVRLLNPDLFDPLPVNIFGSNSIPNVIIIQKGDESMTINLIKEKESFSVHGGFYSRFLELFDERTAEYWYEPTSSKREPLFLGIDLPILMTVSPNADKYKVFYYHGAAMTYMPVYELDELLAIGEYMRENSTNNNLNDFQRRALNNEEIKMRYEEFDGIFRHVFPFCVNHYDDLLRMKYRTLYTFDPDMYEECKDIENEHISHFLIKYAVNKRDFSKVNIQFVNEQTFKTMILVNKIMTFEKIIEILIQIDVYPGHHFANLYDSLYQRAISLLLTSTDKLKWKKRVITCGTIIQSSYENILIPKKELQIITEIPHFENMNSDYLYYPRRVNFPLCDMFYKKGDKIVAIVIAGSSIKSRVITGLNDFMKQVNITDASRIKCVLLCRPIEADGYIITDEIGLKDLEVWKIPRTYFGSMW